MIWSSIRSVPALLKLKSPDSVMLTWWCMVVPVVRLTGARMIGLLRPTAGGVTRL